MLLRRYVRGESWEPQGFPVRGPRPAEIGERLDEVRAWAGEWAEAARGPLRVEYKQVGGRHFGTNTIPARAWLDSYDDAWALLRTGGQVRRLEELHRAADEAGVAEWVARHPMKALELADRWDQLLAVVRWVDERQLPGMYLRQVDVPGVDTKFIETHRGVLAGLLDLRLGPSRIDPGAPDFAGRYRFARKPGYTRFRVPGGYRGFTELSVRAAELTGPPDGVRRVYVLENEITYLAFPVPPDAMAVLGNGYAVGVLEPLTWLAGLDVVYWGDLDTHGFAILNGLRSSFPHVTSMLMDRATLLAHRSHWVTEPSPVRACLDRLSPEESALYQDLAGNVYGPRVRLEQERIRFSAVTDALRGRQVTARRASAGSSA